MAGHREVSHEIEGGFVAVWDTDDVSDSLRDSLRDVANRQVDSLSDLLRPPSDPGSGADSGLAPRGEREAA